MVSERNSGFRSYILTIILEGISFNSAPFIEGVFYRDAADGAGCGARQRHRDGAPGGAGLLARARAPRDPHALSSLGSRKLGVWRASVNRPPKGASQAPWRLPALHPLVFEGTRKTGYRHPGRPKNKSARPAQRWLQPAITTRSFRGASEASEPGIQMQTRSHLSGFRAPRYARSRNDVARAISKSPASAA